MEGETTKEPVTLTSNQEAVDKTTVKETVKKERKRKPVSTKRKTPENKEDEKTSKRKVKVTLKGGKAHDKVKSKNTEGKVMKKRRFKPGTRALQEIRKYQKGTELLIRKLPFQRLVREIAQDFSPSEGIRFTKSALEALQEGTEIFLTDMNAMAYLISLHSKRVTLQPRDIRLALKIAQTKLI